MTNNSSLTLRKALNGRTVQAKVSASSWEQAIEKIGMLMVRENLVEEGYIEAMKNTVRELGPYCVIAPGIAMPHARPEDGVIKTGFTLVTLKTPVEFGSKENDPVDIVIAFAATSKESHINALREIALSLSKHEFVEQIRAAKTSEQLLETIQKHEDLLSTI